MPLFSRPHVRAPRRFYASAFLAAHTAGPVGEPAHAEEHIAPNTGRLHLAHTAGSPTGRRNARRTDA